MKKTILINTIRSKEHMKRTSQNVWNFYVGDSRFASISKTPTGYYFVRRLDDDSIPSFTTFMAAVASLLDLFSTRYVPALKEAVRVAKEHYNGLEMLKYTYARELDSYLMCVVSCGSYLFETFNSGLTLSLHDDIRFYPSHDATRISTVRFGYPVKVSVALNHASKKAFEELLSLQEQLPENAPTTTFEA